MINWRWWRKATPQPTPKYQVVGQYNGYTFPAWEKSEIHVQFAQQLFKDPLFRDALAVLHNSIPAPYVDQINDPTQAAVQLGRVRGYMECLGRLHQLAQMAPPLPQDIQPTYGAPEEE